MKSDSKRMQQVLLNLISNAIKFSQFYGVIVIRVKLLANAKEGKDYLQFSVTDNGAGIKKKDKKKLFKLYGSIKSQNVNQ